MSDLLLKKEFSSGDGDRPVCRVDQVIDTLTVLRGQHLIRTTAGKNTKHSVNISCKVAASNTHVLGVILDNNVQGLFLAIQTSTDKW